MITEMGEYAVGAYLKLGLNCDFVDYNVRPPEGGMAGLGETDVVGLSFRTKTAFLCEVSTHLEGLEYGRGYDDSADRISQKYQRLREYAENNLQSFENKRYMLWCPHVPKGRLLTLLQGMEGLELIIDERYRECIEELRSQARGSVRDIGNPFFRTLQILEHLHD